MAKSATDRLSSKAWSAYVYGIQIAQWLTFYYPQTGLLLCSQTSLVYFATIAKRYSERVVNGRSSTDDDSILISKFAIYPAILLSLIYMFLSRYSLLDTSLWRREQWKASSPPDDVPDGWLQTDLTTGLTDDEVEARRKVYGWNELTSGRRDWSYLLQRQLIWPDAAANFSLMIGGLIALFSRDRLAATIMLGLVFANVGVCFYQTKQADDVVDSLAPELSIIASVVREGQKQDINARNLVPGDIIYLVEGSHIPADCRIVTEDCKLLVDQSSITGDSSDIVKACGDMCYYTCGVKSGNAVARVEALAPFSFVGRTANLVQGDAMPRRRGEKMNAGTQPKDSEDSKKVLQSIGVAFSILISLVIASVFALNEESARRFTVLELWVSLAIAVLPNGVSSTMTTIRAQAAAQLAEESAVVQSIKSIDKLAAVDVLCVDKTGTLTRNTLALETPYCCNGSAEDLILAASLASAILTTEYTEKLDPIDKACLEGLEQYRLDLEGYQLVDFKPFDPTDKVIRSDVKLPSGELLTCVKGAPRAVYELCGGDLEEYKDKATELAERGLRSLGVAWKKEGQTWELLGLLPLDDPPRDDSYTSVKLAQDLEISVKMFTGDGSAIASQFAACIGLPEDILTVSETLREDVNTPMDYERASVFAEVFPEEKLAIVQELQRAGHRVAITGDGIQDAPALHTADVGIAVEGASEKAQSASDVVFLASGLSTIVLAIQISRKTVDLIQTFLVSRAVLSLHLVFISVWYFVTYKRVFDPILLLLVIHCSDMAMASPDKQIHQDATVPKQPLDWVIRTFWSQTCPLAVLLSLGTLSCVQMYAATDATSTRTLDSLEQVIFLHAALSNGPLLLILRTSGRLRSNWHRLGFVLLVQVVLSYLICLRLA